MADVENIEYPADPDRCQGMRGRDQCDKKAILLPDGSRGKYCILHAGNSERSAARKSEQMNYLLTKWKARVEQKVVSPTIKSLKEEIGIIRMLIEEKLNQCTDEYELILQSTIISKLVLDLERLVTAAHKLDISSAALLDREAIIKFSSSVIDIIAEEITDPDKISRIAQRILGALPNDPTSKYTD